ncbi:MAG: RNA methyltransferase [Deltaproteobacteria bacterium]|nr:RNA methyltransferase [Deltaproteobacteria bacterium]
MVRKVTLLRPLKSQLKLWEKLGQVKYRHQEGLFLAEGFKVVRELLQSDWETSAMLVVDKKAADWNDFLCSIPEGIDVYELTETEWVKLSQDKAPEGIMALVAIPRSCDVAALPALDDPGHLLLLYRINNPNNLGAVIRTAHWFGIRKILLSIGSADFTNSKVVRSAMGSLFHMAIIPDVDFAETLPEIKKRYFLVGSDDRKGVIPHACMKKAALLLGSESHGLPDNLLQMTDELWHIPGAEGADSLSLPQAAAIMMYECAKQGTGIRGGRNGIVYSGHHDNGKKAGC